MPRGLRLDVLRGGSDDTITSEQPDLHEDEEFVFLGRMEMPWHGDGSFSEDVDDGHAAATGGVGMDPLGDAAGLHRRMTRPRAAEMKG